MTTQEKLQHLFDAALQSLDEPRPKPTTAASDPIFAPPPWRVKEVPEIELQPQPKPEEDA